MYISCAFLRAFSAQRNPRRYSRSERRFQETQAMVPRLSRVSGKQGMAAPERGGACRRQAEGSAKLNYNRGSGSSGRAYIVNSNTTRCATMHISCGFLRAFSALETLTGIRTSALCSRTSLPAHTGLPPNVRPSVHASMAICPAARRAYIVNSNRILFSKPARTPRPFPEPDSYSGWPRRLRLFRGCRNG